MSLWCSRQVPGVWIGLKFGLYSSSSPPPFSFLFPLPFFLSHRKNEIKERLWKHWESYNYFLFLCVCFSFWSFTVIFLILSLFFNLSNFLFFLSFFSSLTFSLALSFSSSPSLFYLLSIPAEPHWCQFKAFLVKIGGWREKWRENKERKRRI